jgi:uncharacterized protein affecting Mg2+/Co2+ transport
VKYEKHSEGIVGDKKSAIGNEYRYDVFCALPYVVGIFREHSHAAATWNVAFHQRFADT